MRGSAVAYRVLDLRSRDIRPEPRQRHCDLSISYIILITDLYVHGSVKQEQKILSNRSRERHENYAKYSHNDSTAFGTPRLNSYHEF